MWSATLEWVRSGTEKDEVWGLLGETLQKPGSADRLRQWAGSGVVNFDPSKFYLICEELKALYVAVTRAKSRVVFFDEDEAKRAPIFELLERCGVAEKVG